MNLFCHVLKFFSYLVSVPDPSSVKSIFSVMDDVHGLFCDNVSVVSIALYACMTCMSTNNNNPVCICQKRTFTINQTLQPTKLLMKKILQ
jgi:hypothetical protein